MSGHRYLVLGAGKQGKAIAYDLAKFGDAREVIIADRKPGVAQDAAAALNTLLGSDIVHPRTFGFGSCPELSAILSTSDGFACATSYRQNVELTHMALMAGCHMVDLGGNTGVVWMQHQFDRRAKSSGIAIIPDCGMAPGFNVNLAKRALDSMAHPRELVIYCGGIPERPSNPPLNYHFPFSVEGLVNECSGEADVICDGNITRISTLFSISPVLVPAIGALEATHTSGGLSTSPWTFQRAYPMLEKLEYQTLRYPGHWQMLQEFAKNGELEKALWKLDQGCVHDLADIGIIQVRSRGTDAEERNVTCILDVVDRYDPKTHFTAMQRLTGFHAAIVLIGAVNERYAPGVRSVEELEPTHIIDEFEKRGIIVEETSAVWK